MRRIFFPVTIVLLLAAGCGKETAPADRDIPIRLSVSLEGSTKATHASAETIKDLDLVVNDRNYSNYSFSSTRFYRDGSKWKSDTKHLWSRVNANVDILALSPSVSSRTVTISNDTANPLFSWEVESVQTSDSYASDLLTYYGVNNNVCTSISGQFSIAFRHAMSLLTINVTLATEFNTSGVPEDCPLDGIAINGLKLKGDYYSVLNVLGWNGLELRPADGSEGSITTYLKSYTPSESDAVSCSAEYECIVLPQQPASFTVTVGTRSKDFSFTPTLPANFKFEAGKIYTLSLKVGKDKIESSTISAAAWLDGNDENLDDEKA